MKWHRILNPWAEIRRLETSNAILADRCVEYQERMREAESLAFARASEHYYQRSRMMEAQNAALMRQIADISALSPTAFTVPNFLMASDKP